MLNAPLPLRNTWTSSRRGAGALSEASRTSLNEITCVQLGHSRRDDPGCVRSDYRFNFYRSACPFDSPELEGAGLFMGLLAFGPFIDALCFVICERQLLQFGVGTTARQHEERCVRRSMAAPTRLGMAVLPLRNAGLKKIRAEYFLFLRPKPKRRDRGFVLCPASVCRLVWALHGALIQAQLLRPVPTACLEATPGGLLKLVWCVSSVVPCQ